MKIKEISYLFVLSLLATSYSYGQNNSGRSSAVAVDIDQGSRFGRTVSVTNRPGNFLIPVSHLRLKTVDKAVLKESVELDKKKYLSYSYDLAKVDEYDTESYVRYNIFIDQMEFVKDKSIYYLVKEEGRRVVFINSKKTFRVFNFEDDLGFFEVHMDGDKHSLVAKSKVRYVEAKVAMSGYDRARPADYKRLKDVLYLAVDNKKLVKLSKKKKSFFTAFGDKANEIESYVKKNKLKYKSIEDLSKIVAYYNTL